MTRLIPAAAALMLTAAPAMADRVAVLVFDASGSMWNRVEGDLTRIEVARDVMGDYFANRDTAVPLSVIAYGHNRRGDCADIEVVTQMGQGDAASLESRLRALMPRGMTPLTDSLAMARDQIPPTAESADIILVTDGLENCEGDPCALAASLAAEGIDIRAHVVGFGLSAVEVAALSCITDQTGGMLFQTNSGAELAEALQQVSAAEPVPAEAPAPEPAREAAFDISDKAEAGFTYQITWTGDATFVDYMGFVPQGEDSAPASSSYRTIGGTEAAPQNPVPRTAPTTPGLYDLILVTARDGVIARQPVEVVTPAMGFDPIGSVEPGSRVRIVFRGPEQLSERIVIADLDQPISEHQRHGWDNALSKNGIVTLTMPTTPGEYELRYLNAAATEVMFARRFGVGIPFEDADLTNSAELAAQAAAATRGDAAQDDIAAVPATFRLPPDVPQSDVTWDAVPLDADMSPEAWAPMDTGPVISGTFEPGNWRVTAYAPGEVTLSADVAIFPGQANDFTVQINASPEEDHGALGLEGDWRVLAVAPRDAPAGAPTDPMTMVDVTLTSQNGRYEGRFTPSALMTGAPGAEDALDSVREEEGYLFVTFTLPAASPEPFTLSLAPYADGFSGTMASGANSVPVIFWPTAQPLPDMPALQDQLYGQDHGALPQTGEIIFACAEMVCSWTDPASGIILPLPEGWSVTAADLANADSPALTLYSPEGDELRLNPRQWIDSDGACHATPSLGPLCHFNDAAITTKVTASMIAPMMERGEPVTGPQTRPVAISIGGADRSDMRELGIQLVDGEDEIYQNGQVHVSEMALRDYDLIVGNTYDIRAETLFREYRNRNVTITPGNMVQQVVLAPVYGFDEVTLDLPADPVIAGTGGYFPVTFTAPEGFQGTLAVHDLYDRDGEALFNVDAARFLNGQDQLLPVPDQPGDYEVRILDLTGEMIGGADFIAVADQVVDQITVTLTGVTQFDSACFIRGSLTGPDLGYYTLLATVTATAEGRAVLPVLDPDQPQQIEIAAGGTMGQTITDITLRAPCANLALQFDDVQCRTSGDSLVTADCAVPVVFEPLQTGDGAGGMADAILQGAIAADPSFTDATPDGMDADQILDLLLSPAE
jgi:hypothetical protein